MQSENKNKLGMGIMVKKNNFNAFGVTPNAATEVQNTYTVALNAANDKPVSFRFYAGWE